MTSSAAQSFKSSPKVWFSIAGRKVIDGGHPFLVVVGVGAQAVSWQVTIELHRVVEGDANRATHANRKSKAQAE